VDFGKGFYVTTNLAEATEWAQPYNQPRVVHFRARAADLNAPAMCGLVIIGGDNAFCLRTGDAHV
jgi:hypothetical protein